MKKITLIIIAFVLFDAILIGGIFYYKNLRGAGAAIGKPSEDIVDIIDAENNKPGAGESMPSENKTEFPLQLPDGFSISIFAKHLGKARAMEFDQKGTMLVSIPDEGKVVALVDNNNDNVSDETVIVANTLSRPHGVAFKGSQLYIAETNRLAEYDYNAETKKATFKRELAKLPTDGYNQHYTRTIALDPANENRMLVSVGSSCNVCHEEDNRRAKILSVDLATGETKEFARGLRNSVFMAVHPVTGKIWATEMGRDLLGDDIPPDEVNIIEQGKDYGWPICYGKNNHDTDFDKNTYIRNPCMEPFETPSFIDLQAHSAPLGLAFFPEEGWPEEYWHDLLVAYHGSWNRTKPTGYKIVRMRLDETGKYEATEDFITGWLNNKNEALGRPVDILIQPGGTMYISDDKAGVIYRVLYREKASE